MKKLFLVLAAANIISDPALAQAPAELPTVSVTASSLEERGFVEVPSCADNPDRTSLSPYVFGRDTYKVTHPISGNRSVTLSFCSIGGDSVLRLEDMDNMVGLAVKAARTQDTRYSYASGNVTLVTGDQTPGEDLNFDGTVRAGSEMRSFMMRLHKNSPQPK